MADKFVIVRRCTELLHWLVPKSEAFPRAQRFLLTQRLMASAFDCHDAIIEAQSYRSAARIDALQRRDQNGCIPVLFAVIYGAKLEVVQFLCEENLGDSLAWEDSFQWDLLMVRKPKGTL